MRYNVSIRFVLLLLAAFTTAHAADVTGKWTGQMAGPNGDGMSITFDFKQDGTKLTGSAEGPGGQPLQIQEGKVEGDKLSFVVSFDGGGGNMKVVHEGTIKGEEIQLKIKMDGGPGGDGPGALTLKKVK